MSGGICPGTILSIRSDIIVDGNRVFCAGEPVLVETVQPNDQRPEYQYVVLSQVTQTWFQLRVADFEENTQRHERSHPGFEEYREDYTEPQGSLEWWLYAGYGCLMVAIGMGLVYPNQAVLPTAGFGLLICIVGLIVAPPVRMSRLRASVLVIASYLMIFAVAFLFVLGVAMSRSGPW